MPFDKRKKERKRKRKRKKKEGEKIKFQLSLPGLSGISGPQIENNLDTP